MPTFCRHNRFIQNCPICREPQPPAAERRAPRRSQAGRATPRREAPPAPKRSAAPGRSGLRVRRSGGPAMVDDGYRCELVLGLRAGALAQRLADEVAFAVARLEELERDPPGLWGEIASEPDGEEAAWLAFLITYVGPLPDADPFAGVRAARTSWASGELPALDGVVLGPRSAHDPARGEATLSAYRSWAARAGGQLAGLTGDESWSPERRFDRAFERLALPGLHRAARFDLLVVLGRLGRAELSAGSLWLGGEDPVTVAAKRVLGIGDTVLLERRAQALAVATEVPLEALELALYNWGSGRPRYRAGASVDEGDPDERERIAGVLGLRRQARKG